MLFTDSKVVLDFTMQRALSILQLLVNLFLENSGQPCYPSKSRTVIERFRSAISEEIEEPWTPIFS